MIAVLGSLLCSSGVAQQPTADEQKRTLGVARNVSIDYTRKLPDFICTEQVERTDRTGSNNVQTDRLTMELTYFGQKEKQKLVTINGAPTQENLASQDGLITGGEFGSLLLGVFDPSSSADFRWKESSTIRKRRVTVYTYSIARAKSHYEVGHRAGNGGMVEAAAGYHGEVAFDMETNRVLRLTALADDIPKETGILQSSMQVDYDFIDIAGRSYLLPSRSEAHMERGHRQITNVVDFIGYRKFEADSTISFK